MRVLLLVLFLGCSRSTPPPEPPKPPTKPLPPRVEHAGTTHSRDISIVVTTTGVSINGAPFTETPVVADVVKVFGDPDRVLDGPNNIIHTWDRLGVLVYEPHDKRVATLAFVYRKRGDAYHPASPFEGSFRYLDNLFSPSFTLREVAKFPDSKPEDPLTFMNGSIGVFVAVDGPRDPIRVVEISFYNPKAP